MKKEKSAVARGDALSVFISYSRSDSAVADALVDALATRGFDVTIDRRDLPFGEKWQAELAEFIRLSDTVIWLVSSASVTSPWVNWELDEVGRRKKRLVPVMVGSIERDSLPRQLGEIHILPPEGVFDSAVHFDVLVQVLETDRAWLKEASRLADRAHEWVNTGRTAALLLRGGALRSAEAWKDRRPSKAPSPPSDVLELVLASQRAASRRQRYWIAGSVGIAAGALLLAGMAYRQTLIATDRLVRALISQGYGNVILNQPERAVAQFGEASTLASQSSAAGFVANLGVLIAATRSPDSLLSFQAHSARVSAVAISPRGDLLATGGSDAGDQSAKIKIWNLRTGQLQRTLPGHGTDIRRQRDQKATPGEVTALTFDASGERLISAGTDGHTRVWRIATGEIAFDDASHDQVVTHAVLDPASKLLATTGYDSRVRLFDLKHGTLVHTIDLAGHAEEIRFVQSGRALFVALSKEIREFDVAAKTLIQHPAYKSEDLEIGSFREISQGRLLVADRYGRVVITQNGRRGAWSAGRSEGYYHMGDRTPILALQRRRLAAFRSDNRRRLELRSLEGENSAKSFRLEHAGPINAMAADAGETVVVTGGDDGVIRVWPLLAPRFQRRIATPRSWITGLDFDRTGRLLGFSSYGGDVVIVDLQSGRKVVEKQQHNPLGGLVFAGEKNGVVYSGWNGTLSFNDARAWQEPRTVKTQVFALNSLARSDDRKLLLTSEQGSIMLRDAATGDIRERLTGAESAIESMSVIGSGELTVAAAGSQILSWRKGTLTRLGNHGGKVQAVVAAKGGKAVIACGEDGRITIWDASRSPAKPAISLVGRVPIASCWSDVNGEYTLTLHEDGVLAVWDSGSLGQLGVVTRTIGNGSFASLAVSPDYSWLAFTNSRIAHAWHVAAAPKILALRRELGADEGQGNGEGYPPAKSIALGRWLTLMGYEDWAVEAYGVARQHGMTISKSEIDALIDTTPNSVVSARLKRRAELLGLSDMPPVASPP